MQLLDKTFIITGASSGIGEAAARLFSAEGAKLVLGARRKSRLDDLVAELKRQGHEAIACAGDVCDDAYAAELVECAEQEFGRLDGAFNNAGTLGEMTDVSEMSAVNWNDVLATNLTSAFFAARHQVPALKRNGVGAIVFTSSFVGDSNGGMSGMSAYAASKAGLNGFVKSLAAEHGVDGIRINAIMPGGTITEMAPADSESRAFIGGLHALKRMATADEIAQTALFLLSDQASFVTGSAMLVDGGLSAQLTP